MSQGFIMEIITPTKKFASCVLSKHPTTLHGLTLKKDNSNSEESVEN